jgi:hypothetical protein
VADVVKPEHELVVKVQSKLPESEGHPKLEAAIVSAVADKLKSSKIDPAHITPLSRR